MHFVCALMNTYSLVVLCVCLWFTVGCVCGILFAYLIVYETNLIVFTFYLTVQFTKCTRGATAHIG